MLHPSAAVTSLPQRRRTCARRFRRRWRFQRRQRGQASWVGPLV